MDTFTWCGYEWIKQERWGKIHPDKPQWWYDESCSFLDDEENLHLITKYNPKYFNEINGTSSVGVGLVSCTEKFKHGYYSIDAKLPYGYNLWPAFWMWGWDSWPPEIDIFEGYSDNKPNFLKFKILKPFAFRNIQTNLHYTKDGKNKMVGGKTHFFSFKDPTKHFIKYSVEWTKDFVKFYYNNRLVRTIDDVEIMNQLNSTSMNVIINNGITSDFNTKNVIKSDFIIKNFTYIKY